MTNEEFKDLGRGDIVRHVLYPSHSYLVDGNYGNYVTIVRTQTISNPSEWLLVHKQNQETL